MKATVAVLCAAVMCAAAGCSSEAEEDEVTSDTTAVRGADTVGGQVMPTMDTVIRTTTTEIGVDTIHGEPDTAGRDTTKH